TQAHNFSLLALRGTETAPRPGCKALPFILLARGEVRPAILLPAGLVGLGTLRPLLAVADSLQLIGRDAELGQVLLGCRRTAIAQAQVVLGRSALIAMSLDDDR